MFEQVVSGPIVELVLLHLPALSLHLAVRVSPFTSSPEQDRDHEPPGTGMSEADADRLFRKSQMSS